ncbi:hypothetical protein yc1106_07144 [Curvularia clavata]|uniref:Uncharacterized protein n=1 Tax=Curvularia clavata TaxID=95742 RepID=A0A9Q9DVC5_CURCL|nr:hypothetical protein yc1106_07144 [Curvularia clavata]
MAITVSPQPYVFDRQRSLLQLDCSADLRHYSRNLGPGVQERIFQATSDALRSQLDEHRDFLLRHQKQKQLQPPPHLAPVPVPAPALTQSYAHRPYTQPPPPASVLSSLPATIVTRSPTKTVPGDMNTYPLALREALYSNQSTSQADDGRTIYHVISSKASSQPSDEAVIVASFGSMVAANEVAAKYFLEKYLDKGEGIQYKQLGNGALSCEATVDKQRISIYVQEARSDRT